MTARVKAKRSAMGSTITSKGQVTVPAEVRRRMNVGPGDRVVFREENGAYYIEPAAAAVDRLAGIMADLAVGKPPVTIEEMKEAAAAGWAREPIKKSR